MACRQARESGPRKEKRRRPPLSALPLRGNDNDDTDGPPLACGSTSEAAAFEVAALIIT
jgi:hypothetical protein